MAIGFVVHLCRKPPGMIGLITLTRNKQESAVRETRMLRLTWRELETWTMVCRTAVHRESDGITTDAYRARACSRPYLRGAGAATPRPTHPKLLGPAKWTYFCLYVILDVFSRYVTGWMVAMRESAELAKRLIEETCKKQGILPGQLTLHADRGISMTSKSVAFLLADLGVTKTHSRPHVSDDNPFSESQFRTLKYRPEFPDRFGCIQDSRAFCQGFFPLVQRRASPL